MRKIIETFRAYLHYFKMAAMEIYNYYTSPFPFRVLLKKLALAHRKIRIIRAQKSCGRKPLDPETINLILELKKLNPNWGALKISDELAKVGYKASQKTVLKYLEINGMNDPAPYKSLHWAEFLGNHKFKIGIDFTSLITIF